MKSGPLVITLFVHDIKTPLAVIDIGARSLGTMPQRYGPLEPGDAEHLTVILDCRNRATLLLDRILRSTQRPRGLGLLRAAFQNLRRFSLPRTHGAETDGLLPDIAWLHELDALLARIGDRIQALDHTNAGPEKQKVIGRMRRNIDQARHLCARAVNLLNGGGNTPNASAYRLSEVLTAALIDVLDLTDPGASDALNAARQLGQIKDLLAARGMHMHVEECFWQQACVLDFNRVRQVIANLLINALKFRKTRVDVHIEQQPSKLIISVSDDGIGFPPDLIRSIRSGNYRSMPATPAGDLPLPGHGLGLAGTGAMLREMGGSLEISPPGTPKSISAVLKCCPPPRN